MYRVLGKPEGRRPLGRPRRRWVDDNRPDLQEVGCGHVDWIGLAQNRDKWCTLVSAVMNLVLLTQYRVCDKIEKNEMGWACGFYG